MSAPRRAAAARSSAVVPNPAQRSAVAASVEPPPRPPPWGIRLSMVTCALPAGEVERPGDEVRVVERHAGGERAGGRQPAAGGVDDEDVVEVEADHLGVDQVVAVGADSGDPQRSRQLGVGPQRHRCCVGGSHLGDVTACGRRARR